MILIESAPCCVEKCDIQREKREYTIAALCLPLVVRVTDLPGASRDRGRVEEEVARRRVLTRPFITIFDSARKG